MVEETRSSLRRRRGGARARLGHVQPLRDELAVSLADLLLQRLPFRPQARAFRLSLVLSLSFATGADEEGQREEGEKTSDCNKGNDCDCERW